MFSGLVRKFAKVRFYTNQTLCLESDLYPNIGDSIAVNGACLTAIETHKDYFCVELSDMSASCIAVENLCNLVHIEPALRLQDGLHGHIVQGHIDCIGTIIDIQATNKQHTFIIQADEQALQYMINKGSVCIDGISLTINHVGTKEFSLVLIPHTMHNTLFTSYKIGRRVNIETDVITRSVASIVYKYLHAHKNKNIPNLHNLHRDLTQDICDSIALGY